MRQQNSETLDGAGKEHDGGRSVESDQSTGSGHLRASAELRELERQASAARFRLLWLKNLALPVFVVALVAMVLGLVLGSDPRGPIVAGFVGVLGGAAGLVSLFRTEEERLADLECRREELAPTKPEFRSADARRVADPQREPPGGAI